MSSSPLLAVGSGGAWPLPMGLGDGLLLAVVGMLIVFMALTAIMLLVKLQSAVVGRMGSDSSPAAAAPLPAPGGFPAPGGQGALLLHNVPERTAALLMAIVADQMKLPPNELRFISIKEV